MQTTLYGIPNCDTVKKARAWLAGHGVEHAFHDFKKAGVTRPMLEAWLADIPWDTLLNRRGTSWRALPEERRNAVGSADDAIALMLETPSLIKRPVLAVGKKFRCGFSDALYRAVFQA